MTEPERKPDLPGVPGQNTSLYHYFRVNVEGVDIKAKLLIKNIFINKM